MLFEPSRDCVSTTGEGSDHNQVPRTEIINHSAGGVAQSAGHAVPLHRASHRLRNDESDVRSVPGTATCRSQRMHDEIGLRRPHPVTDGGTEFR
ncbi:MAG: hypothetical protein NVS4B6_11850 [Mycobacterium sp.]